MSAISKTIRDYSVSSSNISSGILSKPISGSTGGVSSEQSDYDYEKIIQATITLGQAQASLAQDLKNFKEESEKEMGKVRNEWTKSKEVSTKVRDEWTKFKKQSKKEMRKVRDEVKSIQIKSVEMLGVFVALFTFVSLDFSVLKSSVSLGISVALILVAAGLLLSFLLTMHFILFQESETKFFSKTYLLWIVIIILISAGIFFLDKYGDTGDANSNQSNFKLEISNEIKK